MSPSQKILGAVAVGSVVVAGIFALTRGADDPTEKAVPAEKTKESTTSADTPTDGTDQAQEAECEVLRTRAAQTAHDLLHKKVSREEGMAALSELKKKMAECPDAGSRGRSKSN